MLLITIFVAVIFPCARRRQKRLKLLTEGDGSANVLHRDVEVSEPLKIPTRISRRSSEDKYSLSSFGHHGASFFIFFPFKGLREVSIYLNDLGSISRENLALMSIRTPSLSKVVGPSNGRCVAMSVSLQVPAYFRSHDPPLAVLTTKLSPASSARTPCFTSFECPWPLTPAFRTSIYPSPSSHFPNEILRCFIRTLSLA